GSIVRGPEDPPGRETLRAAPRFDMLAAAGAGGAQMAVDSSLCLPAFAIGDRVCSTARPEWGPGRIATAPNGGQGCVLFREAGARTLSLLHAKLERMDGDARIDPWLELLSLEPVAPAVPHTSPRQAAERFLARHPDGFRDAGYLRRERAPFESA